MSKLKYILLIFLIAISFPKTKKRNYLHSTNAAPYQELNNFIFAEYDDGEREKREDKIWGPWGKWSHCSVTCGKGQMNKFRYCISNSCGLEEKEAMVKPCRMQPCGLRTDGEPNLSFVNFWRSVY